LGAFIADRWPPEGRAERVSIAFGGDQPYREKTRIVGNASAIKPLVVCARCNNEWMKRLEDAVIPILTPMMLGQQLVLDEAALAALGAWVTKTALVFELVQRDSDATASAADRLWFKNHQVPLAGSRIWAARYVGTFGKSWQHARRCSPMTSTILRRCPRRTASSRSSPTERWRSESRWCGAHRLYRRASLSPSQ
jgi:hypothetical protein